MNQNEKSLYEMYNNLVKNLPIKYEDTCLLDKNSFNYSNNILVDEDIVIQISSQIFSYGYGDIIKDLLTLYISKNRIRHLGLCLLDSIFKNDNQEIIIKLENEYSYIKKIIIDTIKPSFNDLPFGLTTIPHKYNYIAEKIDVYSQKYIVDDNSKPDINLRGEKENIFNYEDYKKRNILHGFGSIESTAYLANILLDMGAPYNNITELNFETEIGFGNLKNSGNTHLRIILKDEDELFKGLWKEKSNPFFI